MIKVVLVDDHDLVRHAITALLMDDPQIEVVSQGRSGNEAIKLYEEFKPDVLVLDLQLPGKSGLRASQQILGHDPHAKIVILTASINDFYLTKLQQIGVLGFVTKDSGSADLLNAIHSAVNGERYYCKSSIELAYESQSADSPFNKLTRQEFDVVLQIAYGMSYDDIAKALCVEKITVYTHKNNAYEKLNIRSTEELPYLAMMNGLYPKARLKDID